MAVKKGGTFNDLMMLAVAIPLILSWLFFACYIIYSGINDETGFVQSNLDFYVSLIAIIGGPALLFISSILDSWKGEQAAELNALPARLEAALQEANAKHLHEMEIHKLHHEHDIKMDAFKTTGK
tara:strand:- start:43 stop:417 length:375 start_codon:yes stop_codon:yes gene_type:complete